MKQFPPPASYHDYPHSPSAPLSFEWRLGAAPRFQTLTLSDLSHKKEGELTYLKVI